MAVKAAQDAKAAVDAQLIAGQQAAHQVKLQIAEKAKDAAKMAETALSGREAVVGQLQQEVKEAEAVVREEIISIKTTKSHVQSSIQAAREAQQELKTLTQAYHIALLNVANADKSARGAQHDFIEKKQLLEAANHRQIELAKRMNYAQNELERTKEASIKATASAQEAKINASRNKRKFDQQISSNNS
ncbi:hypothetical protein HCN44_003032 [Aphidius gifuensis]|uniref:Uncharacterized protein n=2 Tax=Aphidius gifuensis TaxID=684658 RepID=A0A834XIF0_APHGI|nr:hypothetical protein HCN44_003032 [Aphidius gifuensis]